MHRYLIPTLAVFAGGVAFASSANTARVNCWLEDGKLVCKTPQTSTLPSPPVERYGSGELEGDSIRIHPVSFFGVIAKNVVVQISFAPFSL